MATDSSKTQAHADDQTHARIDQAADRVEQHVDQAASGTKETVASATEHAAEYAHAAAGAAARGAHHAADAAADWRACGSASVGRLRDTAKNLYDRACGYVSEKPVQSVAIALVAGWLIGRLLSSRR